MSSRPPPRVRSSCLLLIYEADSNVTCTTISPRQHRSCLCKHRSICPCRQLIAEICSPRPAGDFQRVPKKTRASRAHSRGSDPDRLLLYLLVPTFNGLAKNRARRTSRRFRSAQSLDFRLLVNTVRRIDAGISTTRALAPSTRQTSRSIARARRAVRRYARRTRGTLQAFHR